MPCGTPLRLLPKDHLSYKGRKGKLFLQIIKHPHFRLPFGQDPLIPNWVATLALNQKSSTVRFDAAIEMLGFFKLAPDGNHYHLLTRGSQQFFSATIFLGPEDHPHVRPMIEWARFHFFDQMKLWFDAKHHHSPGPGRAPGNAISLSESFYQQIDAHRIPVERHVVAA